MLAGSAERCPVCKQWPVPILTDGTHTNQFITVCFLFWPTNLIQNSVQIRPDQARSHLLCLLAKSPKCWVFVLKYLAGFDIYITQGVQMRKAWITFSPQINLQYTYNPTTAKQMRVRGLPPGPICSLGVLRFKITSFYPCQIEWDRKRYWGRLLKIYTNKSNSQETWKGLHLILWRSLADSLPALFPSGCLDEQTQVKTFYYKDMRNAWTRRRLAFHKLTS